MNFIRGFKIRVKIVNTKKYSIVEALDVPLADYGRDEKEALRNFIEAFNLSIQDEQFRKQAGPFKIL